MVKAFFLSLVLSIDSWAAGMALAARGVRVSAIAVAVVAGLSGIGSGVSAFGGSGIAELIPAVLARQVGGALLFIIGLSVVREAWLGAHGSRSEGKSTVEGNLNGVRLVMQVSREPEKADLDGSGCLGFGEAAMLGVALGLDALAAGVGAGLGGIPPVVFTLAGALTTAATLGLGLVAGNTLGNRYGRPMRVLAGFALAGMGLVSVLLGR